MNWLDLILLSVLGIFMLGGLIRGAIRPLVTLTAILVAFHQTWLLAPAIREFILPYWGLSQSWVVFVLPILSFLIIFLLIRWIGGWIASFFSGGITGIINHLCGGVLGVIIGVYSLGFILRIGEAVLPEPDQLASKGMVDIRIESDFYYPILNSVKYLQNIKEFFLFKTPIE